LRKKRELKTEKQLKRGLHKKSETQLGPIQA
jgi:hypothetical protein